MGSSASLPRYDPQELLNSQPVIVSVIDPATYTVLFQNETGLKKFGDISNASCYEKIAACTAPCAFCRMPESVETGTVVSSEVPMPNDQYLLVHWSKAVTADGRVHVIETITDITKHKRTEHSLRQAQKMEALGRLAGGIAHDFNNLLMVIMGHAHRLAQQFATHPCRHDLELIAQAGSRAAALTRKLLTFSRRQVLEQRELHPNTLIRDLEDILRRLIGEHIQTVVVLDPRVGRVLGDPVQLEQVVMNLALNARDAMSEGGILTIETGNVDLDEAYVNLHPGSSPGSHVRISVEDTGCGISSEGLEHIFEPFYSTKEAGKGTGLGLATVYGIVKQSRGYVEVSSQPGRGSRFTALFPRIVTQGEEIEVPPAVEPQRVSRGSVLVVEDDEGIRNLIGKILTEYGYPVIEASDGVEALKILQTFKGRCDLIIADVIMPRMTGAALVEAVQVLAPDIKVLFVSGYANDTLAANGVGDEPAFLQKPFLPTALMEKVAELLSVPSGR